MTASLLLRVFLLGSDSTSENGINDAIDNHDLPMLSVSSRTGKKDCCLLSGSSNIVLFFCFSWGCFFWVLLGKVIPFNSMLAEDS